LRDRGVGRLTDFPVQWTELQGWCCAELRLEGLELVDLRGGGLLVMGIPTDVVGARSQDTAREWSAALWEHQSRPDGIIYESRLNGETNVAVFNRALSKVSVIVTPRIVDCRAELAAVINDLELAIV
jgi:hypothetical protein